MIAASSIFVSRSRGSMGAIAETHKFQAETNKLTEEANKFKHEPWLAIVVALAALIGALIGSLPNWLRVL